MLHLNGCFWRDLAVRPMSGNGLGSDQGYSATLRLTPDVAYGAIRADLRQSTI